MGIMEPAKVIIGVDEAGTGSWAAGFSVTAYATLNTDNDLIRTAGAKDSKATSAIYRDLHVHALQRVALAHATVFSPHIFDDIVLTWNTAVMSSLWNTVKGIGAKPGEVRVIIDGVGNKMIKQRLRDEGWLFSFMSKADSKVPAVSAASILAKVTRSAMMKELDKEYPEYNWKRNDGYGTEEHMLAIYVHGITKYHRLNRTLEVMRRERGVRS